MDSFKRVTIPQEELGKKLSYDRALDVISYINGTSHANQDACAIEQEAEAAIADAAFTNDDDPFEVSANELDDLLSEKEIGGYDPMGWCIESMIDNANK